MDDDWLDDTSPELGRAPARTVVVRWWSERPDADGAVADLHTRGEVHELDGAPLGIFASFDAMVALLHRLVAEARRDRR